MSDSMVAADEHDPPAATPSPLPSVTSSASDFMTLVGTPPGELFSVAGSSSSPASSSSASVPTVSLHLDPVQDRTGAEHPAAQLFSQQVCRQKHEAPSQGTECSRTGAPVPSPRFGHTAVVHENDMIVHGGRDARCLGDVWAFNFVTRRWREVQPPPGTPVPCPRAGHTAVVSNHKMYIFGGVGNQEPKSWLNDTWHLDLVHYTWHRVSHEDGLVPDGRKGHTAVLCRESMFVFGGGIDDRSLYNDLWEFRFSTHRWYRRTVQGHIPTPRMYHVAVAVPGDKMIIFGGRAGTNTGFLNDVLEITLSPEDQPCRCTELNPSGVPPSHRMCSTAVYHNHTVAIFTGGSFSYLDDSHQLDLRKLQWSPITDVTFGGRTRPTTVKWNNTVLTFGGCVHVNGYVNDFVEVELEPMSLLQHCRSFILEERITERAGLPGPLIEFLDS